MACDPDHSLALVEAGGRWPMLHPFNRAVRLGEATRFAALSAGPGPATYQWQYNGLNLPGATQCMLTLGSVHWTNAGTYRVIVSDARGTVVGPPMILSVEREPLRFDPAALRVETDGSLHTRLLGASGLGPVIVLASSELVAWEPIFTNPPVVGALDFVDAGAAHRPQTFYRASESIVPQPIRLEWVSGAGGMMDNGGFPLRVTGVSALGPVLIHASSNLVDWECVFTNPPTAGPLFYQEGLSTRPAVRFYRASEQR
jgi:hypothetical protein